MINEVKSKIFTSRRILDKCKFIVHRQELLEFWEDMSLLEKQRLLCIGDPMVLSYLSTHIRTFITNRKFQDKYPAYSIKQNNQYLLSLYDCIVYRCKAQDKNMREVVTSFLIIHKHNHEPITRKIHQVIDNDLIRGNLVKVKASYILRLMGFFDNFIKDCFEGQKVIISTNLYNLFTMTWMNRKQYEHIEDYIREIFTCMLVLLQNQIMTAFLQSRDISLIRQRRFTQSVRTIMKPKNKACFTTTTQTTIGKVDWSSLSIDILQLKYRIVEQADRYVCYKDQEEDFDSESDPEDNSRLSEQDLNIATAFRQYKWCLKNAYNSYNSYYMHN